MKICVVGLGALGTVYSCFLSQAGHAVIGVDRAENSQMIKAQGVKVTGIWGEHSARLEDVVADLSELSGQNFDLIIVTVKSFITGQIAREIAPLLQANTFVFLMQNGYGNFEAAALSLPEEQLVLGRVIFGAETQAVGQSKVSVIADDVLLGSPKNLIAAELLEGFAEMFRQAHLPTRASQEIMKFVWDKIIYNSALNSLGSIFEVSYGQLAEEPHTRELINRIIEEIFALLLARETPLNWPDAAAYIAHFYAKLLPPTFAHHSSMLQDIQNGRRTEIDAMNGAIVRLARKIGIPVPVNEVVFNMVKAKESFNLRS